MRAIKQCSVSRFLSNCVAYLYELTDVSLEQRATYVNSRLLCKLQEQKKKMN